MQFYLHTNTLSLQNSSLFKEDTDKLESVYDTLNHLPVGTVFTPQDVVDAYRDLIAQIGQTNGRYVGFYPFEEIAADVEFCTNSIGLYKDSVIRKISDYKYQVI